MASEQRGMYRELGWHKDQVAGGAWGHQEDTTKEASSRLTHEGRLDSPMPWVERFQAEDLVCKDVKA